MDVLMFVNGQAMSGGVINNHLSGATLQGTACTAAKYRFYTFRDEFPGLYAAPGGAEIPGEVYRMSYEQLRDSLLSVEPPELELSVIELSDGSGCLSMVARTDALQGEGVADITDCGGWRSYLSSLEGAQPRSEADPR